MWNNLLSKTSRCLQGVSQSRKLWPISATLLIVAVSIAAFLCLRTMEMERNQLTFHYETQRLADKISEQLTLCQETVQSIADFQSSSQEVTREEFSKFVVRDLTQHGGIQAFGWAPYVEHSNRQSYETSVQESGYRQFQFKQWTPDQPNAWTASPEKWSDEYFPVYYFQPIEGYENAFGIDLASNPTRRKAIELALKTGRPTLTSKVKLAHQTGKEPQTGFVLFVPAYSDPASTETHSNGNLKGFAIGVFRTENILLAASSSNLSDDIELNLVDVTSLANEHLTSAEIEDRRLKSSETNIQVSYPIEFGGREWRLEMRAPNHLVNTHSNQPSLLALLCGLSIAFLIGGVTYSAANHRVLSQRDFSLEQQLDLSRRQRTDCELERKLVELQSRSQEYEATQIATLNMLEDIEASRLRLDNLNKALYRSNEELEQFAYIASHDLQEPLRKVASFCELLKEEYCDTLDEDGNSYLDFAIDGATRMRALVQDLLLFSQIGSQKNRIRPVDTEAALDSALSNLQIAIQESNATVTHDALPKVCAEERELAQLFQNLIGNAIKYRSELSPVVHIGAVEDDDFVRISVSDNGIGIAPEYRERIFGVFKRLHGRNQYSGTGIGLAICKRIVEQLDGEIFVSPKDTSGTTICFSIPKNSNNNLAAPSPVTEGYTNELVSN